MTTKKATHANVYGDTGAGGYGGYRATVMCGKTTIASEYFPCKGWGKQATEESYKAVKTWLAGFGV